MNALQWLAEIKNSQVPNIPKVDVNNDNVANIMSAVLAVAGVVAVLFIIFGAITYVMSQGESSKIKKAKETIVYAIIGLVITTLAFAIVQVVLGVFQ